MSVQTRRERERLARRDAILAAAEPLVLAKGFQGLIMDEVATAAEVSKGTLYLYFANKDALCAAVAERHIREECFPELRARVAQTSIPLGQIRAALECYAEHFAPRPQLLRFVLSWLLNEQPTETSSPDFAAYRTQAQSIFEVIVGALRAGQADGSVREDIAPALLAVEMWTSFLGVLLGRLAEPAINARLPAPVDMAEVIRLHIDRTIVGLRAGAEERRLS